VTEGLNPRALAAVDEGIHTLDVEEPEWREKINPHTLDVSDFCNCVLGQVFGSYSTGQNMLGFTSKDAAADHGFESGGFAFDYDDLQAAWEARLW
jgi:hypothetical protein